MNDQKLSFGVLTALSCFLKKNSRKGNFCANQGGAPNFVKA